MIKPCDALTIALMQLYCEWPLPQTSLRMHSLTAAPIVVELFQRTWRWSYDAEDLAPVLAEQLKHAYQSLEHYTRRRQVHLLLEQIGAQITTAHRGERAPIVLDDSVPIGEVIVTIMDPLWYRTTEKTIHLELSDQPRAHEETGQES